MKCLIWVERFVQHISLNNQLQKMLLPWGPKKWVWPPNMQCVYRCNWQRFRQELDRFRFRHSECLHGARKILDLTSKCSHSTGFPCIPGKLFSFEGQISWKFPSMWKLCKNGSPYLPVNRSTGGSHLRAREKWFSKRQPIRELDTSGASEGDSPFDEPKMRTHLRCDRQYYVHE